MKLKSIQLTDYRNFKDYSIDFGKETTILIGKNGMGKTNLITAIKQSLSFIFSKNKGELQYDFIASSDQKVESFSATDARYKYEGDNGDYCYPVSIKAAAVEMEEKIEWKFQKEYSSSGLKDSLYRDANKRFWRNYSKDNEITKGLPIFSYFSDSYPHVTTNIGTKIQEMLNSGNALPRNAGYYKWDEEKNCTEIWVQYYTMQWKNTKWENGKGDKNYIKLIDQKLINFSNSMSKSINSDDIEIERLEIETRGKDDVLIVLFKNGNSIPFNQLPQGYKRIFSIVFDIANRSYLLNANCDPTGIVLIDEIELHLHPSITQEILTGLKTTFPKIQFIISTHSPLVITNFKQNNENVIYKLYKADDEYKNEKIDDLYGIDYNSGLKDWMDAPYRNSHINELIEAYQYWKSAEDVTMIERLKNKLKDALGEENERYRKL
ncbi:MAG: AAA family ATPase [Candidatus Symbiothrix sp.]|jgi:predicted ATP-binding protein involved in virulence|nr:AAA family ATPase [Candidatus Symbiothrix sp.]